MARWFIARIERFCIPLTLPWYILTLDTARDAVWSIRNISTYIPPSVSNRNFATAQGQPRPHLIPDLRRQCCNESWWNSLKRAVWQPSLRKYDVTQFARLIPACVRGIISLSTFPSRFFLRTSWDARDTPYASSALIKLRQRETFCFVVSSSRLPSHRFVVPHVPTCFPLDIAFSRVASTFPTACLPKIVARNPIPRVPVMVTARSRIFLSRVNLPKAQ